MHKIERMMGIILALNRNKKITAAELSKKFEVDIRTIYRDIQALCEMNIPIISQPGNDGGYSLLDKYFIPPIMFNKDEIFSLLLSEKLINEVHIPGYSKYTKSAYLKIQNVMNDEYIKKFQNIKKRIKFGKRSKSIELSEFKFFDVIKCGLEDNLMLKIKSYNPNNMETIEMLIEPYGIIYVNEVWFVVAFPHQYKEIMSIPIHWINNAELTKDFFVLPDNFNINTYYCQNHCVVKCKEEKDYEIIKLKVDKDSYYNIKDYIFFNDAQIEFHDSKYILTIGSKNPKSYISLAFRFYKEIEIIEPQWLRNEFLEDLNSLHSKYIP